ncbi:MAG: hypothetical protein WDM90_23495 [Ferruginibacter sp.]
MPQLSALKANLFLTILFCLIIYSSCKKSDVSGGDSGTVTTDTSKLILGKWQVIKDSIVTHNFAFSDGTIPIPGVYIGNSNDYYNFQDNGNVILSEGGGTFNSAYQINADKTLLITGFAWGNMYILTINNTSLIFEKSMVSMNGGTYYRRWYFKK